MGQNTCTPPEKPEEKNETATIRYDTKRNQTKRNIVIGQRGLTCPMCPHSIQLIRHVGLTRNANSPRQASQRNNMTEMRGEMCAGVLVSCRQDMLELCGPHTMEGEARLWPRGNQRMWPGIDPHFTGNVTSCGRLPISYLFATALLLATCHIAILPHSHTIRMLQPEQELLLRQSLIKNYINIYKPTFIFMFLQSVCIVLHCVQWQKALFMALNVLANYRYYS